MSLGSHLNPDNASSIFKTSQYIIRSKAWKIRRLRGPLWTHAAIENVQYTYTYFKGTETAHMEEASQENKTKELTKTSKTVSKQHILERHSIGKGTLWSVAFSIKDRFRTSQKQYYKNDASASYPLPRNQKMSYCSAISRHFEEERRHTEPVFERQLIPLL